MATDLETDVLKGVSRSFYLSLRFLPVKMRRPAGLAYLLARISDTIADSASGTAENRIDLLDDFSKQVRGERPVTPFDESFLKCVSDEREKLLLRKNAEVLKAFASLHGEEIALIREVLETIISGQKLDLERFGAGEIHALADASELEDYTWRVAGCVGLFWTRLGFLTLGKKFSSHSQIELEKWAIEYGKGLQLVNILRDIPEDRKAGRYYLPIADPTDDAELFTEFMKWREIASDKVFHGNLYSSALHSKRLRLASGLPAMIAGETLKLLKISKISDLETRIKLPRKRIYGLILSSLLFG